MAENFIDDWEDPKQCVEQVRAIEKVCSHITKIYKNGAEIKAGRDSLSNVLGYVDEVRHKAHEASKKCVKGSKKYADLRAKCKAAEMLCELADDIRDGYFPF